MAALWPVRTAVGLTTPKPCPSAHRQAHEICAVFTRLKPRDEAKLAAKQHGRYTVLVSLLLQKADPFCDIGTLYFWNLEVCIGGCR